MNKNNDCAILTLRTGQLAPKTADGLRNVNFSLTIGRGKEDERGDLKCNESDRKKILEKEVQKIHIPEEPIPFDDFGKKIRYVKKIRELLDQDAELKEIKLLFGRKGLHQGWYYKNETPLASYVY